MPTDAIESNTGRGRKILVAEDDFLLVSDLVQSLENAGFQIIGPVADVQEALRKVEDETSLAGAILDINLGGEWQFSVADALRERDVPFVFGTGYDRNAVPERYADVELFRKPVDVQEVIQIFATQTLGFIRSALLD